jgi:hypothetical protein
MNPLSGASKAIDKTRSHRVIVKYEDDGNGRSAFLSGASYRRAALTITLLLDESILYYAGDAI